MKKILMISTLPFILAACETATGYVRQTVHPLVDQYCSEADPAIRAELREKLGTTPGGATVTINCPE